MAVYDRTLSLRSHQQGAVLMVTLFTLLLLSMLSLHEFELVAWLQKLHHHVLQQQRVQRATNAVVNNIRVKKWDTSCEIPTLKTALFDHWSDAKWKQFKHCHAQHCQFDFTYVVETMFVPCEYAVWGLNQKNGQLQQWPVRLSRITLFVIVRPNQALVTEFYTATLDETAQNCTSFKHSLSLGLQSRRQRGQSTIEGL